MKKIHILFLYLSIGISVFAQKPSIQYFALTDVKLLDGPFKQAQETDLKYMLALDVDRLLAPFRADAGLPAKAERYTNWENTGLDGHTGGHYLTALSLMYASTGNQEVLRRLNYMVSELAECQAKNGNGYVGGIPGGNEMWETLAKGELKVDNFSVNKKWVPWYNIHKLYAGLRDAYLYADNQQAKDVLVKLSDWCIYVTAKLSDAQMQSMMKCEHGGMNEVLADVSVITGDKKYLDMAKRFSHKAVLDPLIKHTDKLNGMHANTQIPKVIGFERIAELSNDTSWHSAAAFFWETVVKNRSVSIGGNSVKEHFHPSNNFSSMIEAKEGPESCNTYNMLKLTKELYSVNSSVKYIDYYERALYNHILSSQNPEHGGFVYFTPMRPQHYRNYSQPQTSFWCCVGSGMENHGKYGEMIYAHTDNELFVNLFIASRLNWKDKGLTLSQETTFPESETTNLKLTLNKTTPFTLKVRYPEWVNANALKVLVNGKEQKIDAQPSSYVAITRKWKSGDLVTISLPMHNSTEMLPDQSPWISFLHGPIVLAAKTDTTDMPGLWADDSRMGHIANGKFYPLENAPMIVSAETNLASKLKAIEGKSLTFDASQLIYPDKFKKLELIPFYKLHESRYMIYWQVTTPEKLEKMQQEVRTKEEAKMSLENLTVDQVAPGEQQPESDHNFQADRTETGVHKDRHWRHAAGWFSYDLKNKDKAASKLQITYYGLDRDRTFNILINDKLLAEVKLDGSHGDDFFTLDYKIPDDILQSAANNVLTVKFVSTKGSYAGGIFDVRLMK